MKKTILVCLLAVCGCVYAAEEKKGIAAAIARGIACTRARISSGVPQAGGQA